MRTHTLGEHRHRSLKRETYGSNARPNAAVREYTFLPCLDTRASVVMVHHWLQVVYDKIVTLTLLLYSNIDFHIDFVAKKKSILYIYFFNDSELNT